jgi:superfamily II DNA or RNA helicase
MYSDFEEYGFDSEKHIHQISGGTDKISKKPILVSTWQSASKQPKEWFDQFDVVIGDEAHRYKANSLKKIMESSTSCEYRFGFTGSLDGSQSNQLTLEGLFGKHKQIKTTKDLINEGYISDVEIKILVLKYSEVERKNHSKDDYQTEIAFLYDHKGRNRFIENLALSLPGNTLLLFQRVEAHGIPLYENLSERSKKVPVYYVSGMIEGEDREQIRKIVNEHENSITVASVGTFSTGVNIPNINNIIVAAPTKSTIRILQTIGRGLRKTKTKTHCTVFDVVDNMQWKKRQNYTLKHYAERLRIYAKEQFNYKIYQVDLK